jgi:hypothetical protein
MVRVPSDQTKSYSCDSTIHLREGPFPIVSVSDVGGLEVVFGSWMLSLQNSRHTIDTCNVGGRENKVSAHLEYPIDLQNRPHRINQQMLQNVTQQHQSELLGFEREPISLTLKCVNRNNAGIYDDILSLYVCAGIWQEVGSKALDCSEEATTSTPDIECRPC